MFRYINSMRNAQLHLEQRERDCRQVGGLRFQHALEHDPVELHELVKGSTTDDDLDDLLPPAARVFCRTNRAVHSVAVR